MKMPIAFVFIMVLQISSSDDDTGGREVISQQYYFMRPNTMGNVQPDSFQQRRVELDPLAGFADRDLSELTACFRYNVYFFALKNSIPQLHFFACL